MIRLVLVAPLALLAACTSYRAPAFTVVDVRQTERTAQGVAMLFTLDAKNDNDVGLPLRDVTYTVELGGKRVFSGTRSGESTLRRLGTQQVTLPAVVNLASSDSPPVTGRVPYRISGSVTYITPGQIAEILFDTGVRVPTAGFSGNGEVELQ